MIGPSLNLEQLNSRETFLCIHLYRGGLEELAFEKPGVPLAEKHLWKCPAPGSVSTSFQWAGSERSSPSKQVKKHDSCLSLRGKLGRHLRKESKSILFHCRIFTSHPKVKAELLLSTGRVRQNNFHFEHGISLRSELLPWQCNHWFIKMFDISVTICSRILNSNGRVVELGSLGPKVLAWLGVAAMFRLCCENVRTSKHVGKHEKLLAKSGKQGMGPSLIPSRLVFFCAKVSLAAARSVTWSEGHEPQQKSIAIPTKLAKLISRYSNIQVPNKLKILKMHEDFVNNDGNRKSR